MPIIAVKLAMFWKQNYLYIKRAIFISIVA